MAALKKPAKKTARASAKGSSSRGRTQTPPVAVEPPAAAPSPPPETVEHKTLAIALLAAQREMREIIKDASGETDGEAYDYATLVNVYENARPVINKHGLVISHEPRMRDGAYLMISVITHAATGDSRTAEWPISMKWLPPKLLGANFTYAQRYNTYALLAIAPKERDTDGADAGNPQPTTAKGRTSANAPPASASAHLMLIDGSSFIYRAFHAFPALERVSDAMPVGGVVGFCEMLRTLSARVAKPTHAVVVFDAGKRTFRNVLYGEYKAKRPPMPTALSQQMPLFRDAAKACGLAIAEMSGFEADDLIATHARAAARAGARVTIVSTDKDLFQVMGDGVSIYDPQQQRLITAQDVRDKFGVWPERAADAQALIGDTVDNVPGAPGIGPVAAGDLLATFGTVEALIARAEEIGHAKHRETVIAHAQQILLSKALVTLRDDVPVAQSWEHYAVGEGEPLALQAFLDTLGPYAEPAKDAEPKPAEPAGDGDASFYADMLKRLARAKSVADLDRWLALCTTEALRKCTPVQRDSLRSEHARKRETLTGQPAPRPAVGGDGETAAPSPSPSLSGAL